LQFRPSPITHRPPAFKPSPIALQTIAAIPPSNSPEPFRGTNTVSDLDLLQGTLDTLVLKTLSWGPRHGYAVARWIKETSDGAILVEDRALYVALHRLEERGWVESTWGLSENNRRAKYYDLTAAGRRHLQQKASAFTTYANAVFKILRTD
jgi:transcriptional regulator